MFSKNRNRSYSNGEIIIYWQGEKCSHATLCYNRLRAVFDPIRRPWINPNAAPTKEILSVIEDCPSDALTFRWCDPNRNETEVSPKLFRGDVEKVFAQKHGASVQTEPTPNQSNATKVDLRTNGPIVVSGNFDIFDSNGIKLKPVQMISLCRCGASDNMPYCDGTHFKIGFRA